ncbi:SDR family oxidoreductase [Paraburkholderia caffeinilytica]|uniref:Short-chain dehydrogenase n=1 Tax=Paraburkholderia caffeinilytica TaxID=1761016 RepID=A0ABQ1LQ62_9BURK|nr:SDR family oxidoreductase [Paraburkholderia caffeinilytica]GGC27240.1 short-chain dehydrogenase [Paraburkholderia caffeinilytica]CAB3780135.1 Oxidoreductase UcpA [Paraburkholderia caffeinilytica]
MELGIAGKIALVTGGSKGIGRETSLELARAGCQVLVAARGKEAIDETVAVIRGVGGVAAGFSGDFTDVENYRLAVAAAKAAFGSDPDIAVFNLQAPKPGSFEELNDDDFRWAYHLVVTCYMNLVRAVVPSMKERRWGRIVTIGSGTARMALRSTPYFSYVLANTHRVSAVGLIKTLMGDYGPFGITFNTIGVGSIETEQFKAWMQKRADESGVPYDDVIRGFAADNPLRRVGRPVEVAKLCTFLCSEYAGFTTGETVLCDGGQVICLP